MFGFVVMKHMETEHMGASEAKLLPRIYRAKPAPYGAGISCVLASQQRKNRPHVLHYHKTEHLSTVNVVSCKIKNPVVNSL